MNNMHKPTLKLGIDDRLLAVILSLLVCAGCLVQSGNGKPAKPKTPATSGVSELSRLALLEWLKESADAIDKVADRVEAGELKYDKPLQDALTQAFNTGLQSESNRKLSAEMAKIIKPGDTFDPKKTGAVLRANAKGRRVLR